MISFFALFITLALTCDAKTVYMSAAAAADIASSTTESFEKSASTVDVVASPSSAASIEKNTSAAISNYQFLPNELNVKDNLGQVLIACGAAAAGIILMGIIATIISPIFGIKLCHIIGGCESPALANTVSQPNYNDVYGAYIPQSAAYGTYRKRSLDYVAPILKTLIAAYEKYGHQQQSKKTE